MAKQIENSMQQIFFNISKITIELFVSTRSKKKRKKKKEYQAKALLFASKLYVQYNHFHLLLLKKKNHEETLRRKKLSTFSIIKLKSCQNDRHDQHNPLSLSIKINHYIQHPFVFPSSKTRNYLTRGQRRISSRVKAISAGH